MRAFGAVLIVVGALIMAYQGITYTKRREVVRVGPIEATAEQKRTIPISPVVGGVLIVAGLVLVVAGRRRA